MITVADAVRVLCFGDSNTFGVCRREPGVTGAPTPDPDYVRLDADRRSPGVLQRLLGEGYDVIEEGLNGRTVDSDDSDRPWLNGRTYFLPCVLSHQPIDVVVVMLGGNDLKPGYQRSPAEIADGLAGYVDDLATHVRDRNGRVPATILVGPTAVDDTAPMFRDLVGENFDPRHAARSHELSTEIRRVAERVDVLYADPSTAAGPGIDGLHLSMEAHAGLAGLIAGLVRRET